MGLNNHTEILQAVSSGDRIAFKKLFISYFPKVKFFVAHMIKDEFAAEDLAQDIFIKLWEGRATLGKIYNFDAYLYRTTRNTVLNWLRKEQQDVALPGQPFLGQSQQPSTEEEYIAREMQLLVELTVSKMPEKRKKIYTMSRVEGLKNEEIANHLNITKKTVEVQLNLALREIRKTLSTLLFFFF